MCEVKIAYFYRFRVCFISNISNLYYISKILLHAYIRYKLKGKILVYVFVLYFIKIVIEALNKFLNKCTNHT